MNLPFEVSQTLWAPRTSAERVTVPCPVCKGALAVKVICGDETFAVPCDGCGLGFHVPQGTITEYEALKPNDGYNCEYVSIPTKAWRMVLAAHAKAEGRQP